MISSFKLLFFIFINYMIPINERIDFYKGAILRNNIEFTLDYKKSNDVIKYNNLNIRYFSNVNDLQNTYNNEKLYSKPMSALLNMYHHTNKPFLMSVGDIYEPAIATHVNIPVFTKNRMSASDDDTSIILRSLNFTRHWKLYHFSPPDIPFDIKKNTIYWRGVSTGNIKNPGNRFVLLYNWFNKHNYIDIGFIEIVQEKYDCVKYLKGKHVWPKQFLKHKYLLSVEGNDKDSGLNWKLNSNSVVLMAKPRCQSWLMESKLIPGVHYILLKDDFSDLNEKYIWCQNHQVECKQIIKNANKYMHQFSNNNIENMIEKTLIDSYFQCLKQ